MRISDWSSDVCSSDLADQMLDLGFVHAIRKISAALPKQRQSLFFSATMPASIGQLASGFLREPVRVEVTPAATTVERIDQRSEEHTSELQSLMRISYAVICLKKKKDKSGQETHGSFRN